MKFYNQQHKYYCGIDLHARKMYVCILDQKGEVLVHKNIHAKPEPFLKVIQPYREDIAVAVECIFTWYWIADFCVKERLAFVLGHALYMKAIHGGKTKNDKIDSHKIAVLLKGGMLPMAYVYPAQMRSTRDLLRRRMFFTRKRAELLAHIQMTNTQYNLPPFEKRIDRKSNRKEIENRFHDKSVQKTIEADLAMLDAYDKTINDLELHIKRKAKIHDMQAYHRLQSVPGIGEILGLVLLYEIHDISRFPRIQDFVSYARLIRPMKESGGKQYGTSNKKIGNHHLKWAFSEAACIFKRDAKRAQKYIQWLENRYGKARSLSVLTHKLGRAVYYMLKHGQAFNMNKFISGG
jgi:transposase